jgi:hypothetical protein
MTPSPFKPGDICLVHSVEELGQLIDRFETSADTTQIVQKIISHAAVCVDALNLIEATLPVVKKNPISKYITDPKNVMVCIRVKSLTDDQRNAVATNAGAFLGRLYGWNKLILHLGDNIVSWFARKDVFFFRKLITNQKLPICSELVADCYQPVGWTFCGIKPEEVQPMDIFTDFAKRPKEYAVVYCDQTLLPWVNPVGADRA